MSNIPFEKLQSPKAVTELTSRWKKEDKTIALVPTMGCLHEGHLSLVRLAKQHADKVVVSIFVNPKQFGPTEDFDRYPKTFEDDIEKLSKEGIDLLFAPTKEDMYPHSFYSHLQVNYLSDHLCGKSRPHFFGGVCTVCLKLFNITQPDFAIFGEKDFQQLKIIEQMVSDLNLNVKIIPAPIIRGANGMALSSRNSYLNEIEREHGSAISRVLFQVSKESRGNSSITVGDIAREVESYIERHQMTVDYVEIASSDDLQPKSREMRVSEISKPRIFVAAVLGTTRLIDNMAL